MDEIEPIGTVGTTITVDHLRAAMERLKREPTEEEWAVRIALERAAAAAFHRLYEHNPEEAWRFWMLMNCDG